MQKKPLVLHIFATLFALCIIFYSRIESTLPLHVDEWWHLELAREVVQGDISSLFHLEPGFTLFLIVLWWLPLVKFNIILPLLFTASMAVLFWLYTKNKWLASVGILLYAALPSNNNILGVSYGVPMHLGLVLFFLVLLCVERYNIKPAFLAALLVVTLLTHPPSGIAAGIVALQRYKQLWKYSVLGIVAVGLLFYIKGSGNLLQGIVSAFLDYFFFDTSFAPLNVVFNPIQLFGYIAFFFAMMGLYFVYRKTWGRSILFVFLLLNIILFALIQITVFVPYVRGLYIWLFLLILYTLDFFTKAFQTKDMQHKIILVIACVAAVSSTYIDLYDQSGMTRFFFIDQQAYEDIKKLETLPVGTAISKEWYNNLITPISGQPVVTVAYYREEYYREINAFFSSSCQEMTTIVQKFNISYVVSPWYTPCENYTLLHDGSFTIYATP